jgi:hypothetical protein
MLVSLNISILQELLEHLVILPLVKEFDVVFSEPKVRHCAQKSPPLRPILTQVNSVQSTHPNCPPVPFGFLPCVLGPKVKGHLLIIFHSRHRFSETRPKVKCYKLSPFVHGSEYTVQTF